MASDSDSDCPPLLRDDDENEFDPPVPFSLWRTFKPHVPRFIITVLVDVVLPMLVYLCLQQYIRPVYALLAAGIPPLIMIVVKAIVSRTFDALGFIILIGFAGSAIAAIITHNPKIILLEKSLVTGFISIVFAVTLLPLDCFCQLRPLAFYFYQDLVPTNRAQVGLPDCLFDDDPIDRRGHRREFHIETTRSNLSRKQEVAQVYEWLYAHCSSFRYSCYSITSVWSLGLLLEFLARFLLIVLRFPVHKVFIYGHIILTSITVLLILLTIYFITRERKQTLLSIEQWKNQHLTIRQRRPFALIIDNDEPSIAI